LFKNPLFLLKNHIFATKKLLRTVKYGVLKLKSHTFKKNYELSFFLKSIIMYYDKENEVFLGIKSNNINNYF
jgi:hypothetical protein